MLVPDDPKGSRDAIDDDGNSMSGSEVAQCLKKKTQSGKNGEQTGVKKGHVHVWVCDDKAEGGRE